MTATRPVVIVRGEDSPELREALRALQDHPAAPMQLVLSDGETVVVSAVVAAAIQQLVAQLATGERVAIGPAELGYTTTEAARLLGVWQPYLLNVIESGELPHHQIGTEPRIGHADLMAFRAKLRARRAEGVRLIQQLSEEEGAYDRW